MNSTSSMVDFKQRLEEFKILFRKAIDDRYTYREFYQIIRADALYMEDLMLNNKTFNFPNPLILKNIADKSNEKVNYEELMRCCGYSIEQLKPKCNRNIFRGDIFYCDLGEDLGNNIQAGIRLVVCISNPRGLMHSNIVTIAPVTSRSKKDLPTHLNIGQECGIEKPSTILCEQIRTIPQEQLGDYVGSIRHVEGLEEKLNKVIKVALGVWNIEDEILEKANKIQDNDAFILIKMLKRLIEKYRNKELVILRD